MKKLLKQLLAVTTAIMMAITLLPAMANAADAEAEPASPTTTIDYEKKGSITINKTTAIKDGKTTPLPGAEFTIYKIATLTADSTETSKLEKELSVTVNGKTYNTIGSLLNLDSATQKEVASKFADKVKTQTGIISDTKETGDGKNGTTKGQCIFNDLSVGYYLVVETKTPIVQENGKDTIQYVASTPFFVAIPQSDQTTAYDEEATEATTAWQYDVVATPKNEEVSIDKKIVGDETPKDKDTVAVGDTINYEITSTSPKYTAEYFDHGEGEEKTNPTYKIYDTLSKGLTLNTLNDDGSIQADSIKVFVNNKKLDSQTTNENQKTTTWYTLSPTTGENGKTGFMIEFTTDFLKEYKGATVKVNYSVTVNENAVVGTDGNTNDVKLEYTRKPGDPATGVPGKTTPKVYTYGLVVKKVDGKDNKTSLSGAEFKLYKVETVKVEKENGEVEEKEEERQITNLKGMVNGTYTTGADGVVTFDGLDVGKYRLEEVKAPKDYTLLKDKIEFTITDENPGPDGVIDGNSSEKVTINGTDTGRLTTTITNNKGFNLPSTGGMGTYIFTIGGLVVMAGAVLLLVSSKKKRA